MRATRDTCAPSRSLQHSSRCHLASPLRPTPEAPPPAGGAAHSAFTEPEVLCSLHPSPAGVFNYNHLKTSISSNYMFSHLGNNL